jgi:hypothetical protein
MNGSCLIVTTSATRCAGLLTYLVTLLGHCCTPSSPHQVLAAMPVVGRCPPLPIKSLRLALSFLSLTELFTPCLRVGFLYTITVHR